jgi:hypothetical protein
LKHVVNSVLFGNHQDVAILFGCIFLILLHRTLSDRFDRSLVPWDPRSRSFSPETAHPGVDRSFHPLFSSLGSDVRRPFHPDRGG